MVKENSFILDNFKEISGYRNDIMHAHNMDYSNFCKALLLITSANEELELLLLHYFNQTVYIRPDILNILNSLTKKMFLDY